MEKQKAINILQALLLGCSPETGELIEEDSVLNETQVIRAIQIAIFELKNSVGVNTNEIEIDNTEIQRVIALMEGVGLSLTSNRLTTFFLGTRKFKSALLLNNDLFGKYKGVYLKNELLGYFNRFLAENNLKNERLKYREIEYFQKQRFNNLSAKAKNRLSEKISELGIRKTDNLAENVMEARIKHPRAYENWSNEEKKLLLKVLEYTNDLEFLSKYFQRGLGAIESCGQKLIYLSENRNGKFKSRS